VPASDSAAPPQPESHDRSRFAPLRRRATNLDLRNTWQVLAGAILLPLGIAVILLGWNGAAHGRVDQQQIPYVISGGLLGLAVVIIGCFFYWAHWLYRLYDQADLRHEEMMREQREMMRALLEALGQRPMPAGEDHSRQFAANGSTPTFVVTPSGTNFHSPGCPMVASRGSDLRVVGENEIRNMKPCRVCEPIVHHN
jgi:hypothetical protein